MMPLEYAHGERQYHTATQKFNLALAELNKEVVPKLDTLIGTLKEYKSMLFNVTQPNISMQVDMLVTIATAAFDKAPPEGKFTASGNHHTADTVVKDYNGLERAVKTLASALKELPSPPQDNGLYPTKYEPQKVMNTNIDHVVAGLEGIKSALLTNKSAKAGTHIIEIKTLRDMINAEPQMTPAHEACFDRDVIPNLAGKLTAVGIPKTNGRTESYQLECSATSKKLLAAVSKWTDSFELSGDSKTQFDKALNTLKEQLAGVQEEKYTSAGLNAKWSDIQISANAVLDKYYPPLGAAR